MTDYKVYLISIDTRCVECGHKVEDFLEFFDREELIFHSRKDGYELILKDSEETYIRVFTDKASDEFDAYLDTLVESGFRFYFTDDKK